jgi:hypothetical protein
MIGWTTRFDIETEASPEQVRRALTDFTQRRLRIWNRTLDPKTYELREHGPMWAVARESTLGSPFWVVARYDWFDPAIVRWTVVESSYGGGGRVAPRNDGGSRLHAEWTSTEPRRQKATLFCGRMRGAGAVAGRSPPALAERRARHVRRRRRRPPRPAPHFSRTPGRGPSPAEESLPVAAILESWPLLPRS